MAGKNGSPTAMGCCASAGSVLSRTLKPHGRERSSEQGLSRRVALGARRVGRIRLVVTQPMVVCVYSIFALDRQPTRHRTTGQVTSRASRPAERGVRKASEFVRATLAADER